MGTEQQQELKSEKQTTKQRRKYIPFTDLSIKNWKPKKDKEKIGFSRHNTLYFFPQNIILRSLVINLGVGLHSLVPT